MGREKTIVDKKQYHKDYYHSHKVKYQGWSKAYRERRKRELAEAKLPKFASAPAKDEDVNVQPTESIATATKEVYDFDSCFDDSPSAP